MSVTVVDHPIAQDRLTILRNRRTSRRDFRMALNELSRMVLYEALRDVEVATVDLDTPLGPTTGWSVSESPVIVPVLRAGLGMLDTALELLPDTRVGFVGLRRDEATHEPESYLNTLPDDLEHRPVLVIDPMLATGGSLLHTLDAIGSRDPGPITVACILAAPEGLAAVDDGPLGVRVFTAAVDDHLDASAFIVPGLGDAGDRQYGTA